MKKLFLICLIPLVLLAASCVNESPEPLYVPTWEPGARRELRTVEYDGVTYRLFSDSTCEIIETLDDASFASSLVLPDSVNDCAVVAIADNVFKDASFTHVTLPAGLERIGARAFSHTQITSLELPDGLAELGEEAFSSCVRLETVRLPASLTEIPTAAFYGCRALKSLAVPEGVEIIGEEAFGDIPALETVTLPSTLRQIGAYAFWRCGTDSLTFSIPDKVAMIGVNAFAQTAWMKASAEEWLIVGDGVLLAYRGTEKTVTVPDSVRYLSNAFDLSPAEEVTLPETLVGAAWDALAESRVRTVRYTGACESVLAVIPAQDGERGNA